MAYIRYIGSDYPESKIPPEFDSLLNIGKKSVEVQIFGFIWIIATIEEWERRVIAKALSNLDNLAKTQLQRVEILTQAIVGVKDPLTTQEWRFYEPSEKIVLRSLLLTLDSKVIDSLFYAYTLLEAQAQKEFDEKYPNILKEIKEQILGPEIPEIKEEQNKELEDKNEKTNHIENFPEEE